MKITWLFTRILFHNENCKAPVCLCIALPACESSLACNIHESKRDLKSVVLATCQYPTTLNSFLKAVYLLNANHLSRFSRLFHIFCVSPNTLLLQWNQTNVNIQLKYKELDNLYLIRITKCHREKRDRLDDTIVCTLHQIICTVMQEALNLDLPFFVECLCSHVFHKCLVKYCKCAFKSVLWWHMMTTICCLLLQYK